MSFLPRSSCIVWMSCASRSAFASSPMTRLNDRAKVSSVCRTSGKSRTVWRISFASLRYNIAWAVEICGMLVTHDSKRARSSEADAAKQWNLDGGKEYALRRKISASWMVLNIKLWGNVTGKREPRGGKPEAWCSSKARRQSISRVDPLCHSEERTACKKVATKADVGTSPLLRAAFR